MAQDVSSLHTKVDRLGDDVAELKGDVAELKGDVAELKGDVATIKTILLQKYGNPDDPAWARPRS